MTDHGAVMDVFLVEGTTYMLIADMLREESGWEPVAPQYHPPARLLYTGIRHRATGKDFVFAVECQPNTTGLELEPELKRQLRHALNIGEQWLKTQSR